ncbi:hypothetical protein [Nannocystis pusilla]|uniref:hypothetical protein n=1 Tax=Nannocystis pusilla TaxID=889268 RepID=UPI003B814AC8
MHQVHSSGSGPPTSHSLCSLNGPAHSWSQPSVVEPMSGSLLVLVLVLVVPLVETSPSVVPVEVLVAVSVGSPCVVPGSPLVGPVLALVSPVASVLVGSDALAPVHPGPPIEVSPPLKPHAAGMSSGTAGASGDLPPRLSSRHCRVFSGMTCWASTFWAQFGKVARQPRPLAHSARRASTRLSPSGRTSALAALSSGGPSARPSSTSAQPPMPNAHSSQNWVTNASCAALGASPPMAPARHENGEPPAWMQSLALRKKPSLTRPTTLAQSSIMAWSHGVAAAAQAPTYSDSDPQNWAAGVSSLAPPTCRRRRNPGRSAPRRAAGWRGWRRPSAAWSGRGERCA